MDFKPILKEQLAELKAKERTEGFVPRDKAALAESYLKSPNILAVLGVRRAGKSVFSYMLAARRPFGYVNFLDERLAGIRADELDTLLRNMYELQGDMGWIVLDEIQDIPKWELFAARLRTSKRVIVTGSNSKLLSGELGNRLTGRHLDIVLNPFSFWEYLACRKVAAPDSPTTRELADIVKALEAYLDEGGFPEVQRLGKACLRVIYEDIITKDVLARHRIDNPAQLRALARFLVSNCGNETSYAKLGQGLGIRHVSTVSNWISFLEESFLIMKLERFDFKLKKQFLAPKKIYCVDNGLLGVVGFSFTQNRGALLENAVASELWRRKEPAGQEIFYWKDHRQNEVDFIVKGGRRVSQLIQVTSAESKDDIRDRETRGLLEGSKALRCEDLKIITWNYEGVENAEGKTILCVPLWKWLLGPGERGAG